ncbi:glycosyltransferase family 2 protein [Candidatus Gottesmanbacteria bacterium]|nr:glycosyltransferase family 2 protein [Candidatus Gottesmanbacteria bacterium]
MPRRSKITAIILTLNEEKNIADCLKSVKWVDEIVVVDSGSTDKTIEIAKEYTDKIYYHKFESDFSKQRNFAITKAKGEWILFLDADETLPKGSEEKIKELIANTPSRSPCLPAGRHSGHLEGETIEGFWFPRRNYINKARYLKHGLFYPDWQLRLLRYTKGLQFIGSIHEQPDISHDKTQKVKDVEIFHNSSRTKYDSFFSFYRLFPFIKADGQKLASSSTSTTQIFLSSFSTFFLELWWNLVRRQGHKDGWPGIRGTLIWALYKELSVIYALVSRIIKR